jgi:ankyrin repeat protein
MEREFLKLSLNSTLNESLFKAIMRGNMNRVKELLKKGANIHTRDRYGRQPIHFATIRGRLPLVKFFLNQGASARVQDVNGVQPIHYAARRGSLPVVEELIKRGANIHARSKNGRTPIHWAAASGELPVVKFLLKKGAIANNILKNKNVSDSMKKYLENHYITHAFLVYSKAKGKNNQNLVQTGFPINALVKSIKNKVRQNMIKYERVTVTKKRPRDW